jgi:hypothetical protein
MFFSILVKIKEAKKHNFLLYVVSTYFVFFINMSYILVQKFYLLGYFYSTISNAKALSNCIWEIII